LMWNRDDEERTHLRGAKSRHFASNPYSDWAYTWRMHNRHPSESHHLFTEIGLTPGAVAIVTTCSRRGILRHLFIGIRLTPGAVAIVTTCSRGEFCFISLHRLDLHLAQLQSLQPVREREFCVISLQRLDLYVPEPVSRAFAPPPTPPDKVLFYLPPGRRRRSLDLFPPTPPDQILFYLPVTKAWLRQLVLGLLSYLP
jgi:hypothetical protein